MKAHIAEKPYLCTIFDVTIGKDHPLSLQKKYDTDKKHNQYKICVCKKWQCEGIHENSLW